MAPKLRDIYVNANKEIRELFNALDNAGSDIMWAGLVMDSLLKEKQESNGVIQ